MKISSLPIIVAAFLFSLSLLAPGYVDAASSHKAKNNVHKTVAKKAAAKTVKKSQASRKAEVAESKRTNAERDIWLKRAQASEALSGKASWYGKDFHNKATASGLAYDMHTFTAAHRTLPIGTIVKVTDQHNGKSVMVCVTDRGPFVKGRIIDLSYAAAKRLDLQSRGVGKVELEVVSDENGAPIKKGQAFFVKYASGSDKSKVGPFHAFADAAAMHEALIQAHPEAEVIVEKDRKP